VNDYVILMTLTQTGAVTLEDLPGRVTGWIEDWRANCGPVSAFRVTIGAQDFVLLGQAPDDESAAAFALRVSMGGLVKTTCMRAFNESALEDLVREAITPSGRGR
jgi:uncharacterized protein with GYD domain